MKYCCLERILTLLKCVAYCWKQLNCTGTKVQVLVTKSLFQLECWNNGVVKHSSVHFPGLLGNPSPAWAAACSELWAGAAWLG